MLAKQQSGMDGEGGEYKDEDEGNSVEVTVLGLHNACPVGVNAKIIECGGAAGRLKNFSGTSAGTV